MTLRFYWSDTLKLVWVWSQATLQICWPHMCQLAALDLYVGLTTDRVHLINQRLRLKYKGDCAFTIRASQLWNYLPENILQIHWPALNHVSKLIFMKLLFNYAVFVILFDGFIFCVYLYDTTFCIFAPVVFIFI